MVQSSTRRGGSHPNPAPQNEYSKRLEDIRALRGVPDVKAFWAKLVDRYGEDRTRSYASARYYHYDRDPPVDYLRQVAEVYNSPLEYLATGVGPATNEEKEGVPPSLSAAIEDLRGGLLEEFPHFRKLPDSSRTLVWRLLNRACPHLVAQDARGGPLVKILEANAYVEAGRKVGRYLSSPFAILGIDPDALEGPTLALMVEGLARPIEVGIPHDPMSRLFSGEVRFGPRQEVGPEGFVVGGAENKPPNKED